MPYKTEKGRLVNEVTLGDGYPLSVNLQPLKVGGKSSPLEVSTSSEDESVNGKVKIKGDLEVTGTTKGISSGSSVDDASTTTKGIVELATTAETTTGTDTARAVTPDGLKDGYQGSANVTTLGTIGTGTWNGTAIASAYLDSDTAHLSGTQTFSGKKTFNANLAVNGQIDMQTSENVLITSSGDTNLALHVDGEDKIVISDETIKFETNSNLLKERSAAGGDVASYGQIWVKNDAPNNLYFTDDTGQDIAITANGHLAQKHIIQINARVYNRYNHWFYPTFTWGTNAENWNSTRSSASLETTWFDSWNPILVVPHNMTLNEYYMYGNSTATHTIEHALLHGTGVTWDDTNADNFSLAQIGSTQSGDWTSGRYNDLGQTGLSVDLAKGDMIMPAFRRTTGDTSSTYSYLEICFVAVCTLR